MILHVLFGQPKEAYPGEHVPVAIAVCTDTYFSKYPNYFDYLIEAYTGSNHSSLKVIPITIDDKKVKIFLNFQPTLDGRL